METVDQIQARLRALLSEAYQARMLALQSGDKQDAEKAATLMDEIEARLMQHLYRAFTERRTDADPHQ